MADVILDVQGLKTYYRTRLREHVYAVDGVSLQLKEGRVLGIAGESGCGKSTLALSLMGFYFPPLNYGEGKIVLEGTDLMKIPYETLRKNFLGTEIAYIPQAAMNALNQTRKLSRFAIDILTEHRPDMSKEQMLNLTREKFAYLNLPERVLTAYPSELSGGMKQRAVIALSTLLNPKVLIADEPSSALDVSSQKVVISMLRKMMKEGFVKSMIFITHELPLLRHVADDIVVMYAGELVEQGSSEEVIFDPMHPYSHALMGSIIVPEGGMKEQKLTAIPGAPPNLKRVPDGCRFYDRCMYACDACRAEKRIGVTRFGKDNSRYHRCIFTEAQLREKYAAEEKFRIGGAEK
ncbi:MAG: ABC transporter ATP-binding protein [Christensenellales bacterium]|jgi:peptide/nickel transport system ATP-binding protein